MSTSRTPVPPKVGALLRMAWEELTAEVVTRLADLGFDGLRRVHYPIIRELLLGGRRPTELAATLGLSKQATNDLLREFEALGYLALEPDPHDGRGKRIAVTDRGWELWNAAARVSADVTKRWAKKVGKDRYAVFEGVLRELVTGRARASARAGRSPTPKGI